MRYTLIDSPVGAIMIAGGDEGIAKIYFMSDRDIGAIDSTWRHEPDSHADAAAQLNAYFAGELREFDLQLAPSGTSFQREVWSALRRIPYGATASYGDIARMIGKPDAVRAVGAANGRNPLAIVVPCHRVIGSDGSLVGYSGGMHIKVALLKLEGAWHPPAEQLSLL
jgi:methylated-DNA-[protein]-cysteine S-methyltransferase